MGCGEEHHDIVDELMRQIQKKENYEKDANKNSPIYGHPDVHRLLKELVKQEAE